MNSGVIRVFPAWAVGQYRVERSPDLGSPTDWIYWKLDTACRAALRLDSRLRVPGLDVESVKKQDQKAGEDSPCGPGLG